ncbi:MAG: hypothetical protein NWE76_01630, partial [Candidatus Bathyarchaeota archaeon]|nr:hypothetical protein [Candidatus Bathyarchaeota archaeon]
TYRMILEHVIRKWDNFRRALRRDDREAFDKMMNKARMHSSASVYNIQVDPTESMFMSILLEQEKDLDRLKDRVGEKEE